MVEEGYGTDSSNLSNFVSSAFSLKKVMESFSSVYNLQPKTKQQLLLRGECLILLIRIGKECYVTEFLIRFVACAKLAQQWLAIENSILSQLTKS